MTQIVSKTAIGIRPLMKSFFLLMKTRETKAAFSMMATMSIVVSRPSLKAEKKIRAPNTATSKPQCRMKKS